MTAMVDLSYEREEAGESRAKTVSIHGMANMKQKKKRTPPLVLVASCFLPFLVFCDRYFHVTGRVVPRLRTLTVLLCYYTCCLLLLLLVGPIFVVLLYTRVGLDSSSHMPGTSWCIHVYSGVYYFEQ